MTAPAARPDRPPVTAPGRDPHADLRDAVGRWFGETARDLPWRAADRTAWGVLVSEVMLQQTPVVRVEP
ncbi:MAG: adenine glycosylase, partial [Cellulosimicrobium sp.]|nr:adenine glycosylase [Cellulosimicrobium sp.]